MTELKQSNEQRYYDALRRIAKQYDSVEKLRRHSEDMYGLEFLEALEMAYENITSDAKAAIRGKRRPKL